MDELDYGRGTSPVPPRDQQMEKKETLFRSDKASILI